MFDNCSHGNVSDHSHDEVFIGGKGGDKLRPFARKDKSVFK